MDHIRDLERGDHGGDRQSAAPDQQPVAKGDGLGEQSTEDACGHEYRARVDLNRAPSQDRDDRHASEACPMPPEQDQGDRALAERGCDDGCPDNG